MIEFQCAEYTNANGMTAKYKSFTGLKFKMVVLAVVSSRLDTPTLTGLQIRHRMNEI